VRNVAPSVKCVYLPHAVDSEVFKPLPEEEILEYKEKVFGDFHDSEKVVFLWNNRNARRKQSGSLIYWFKTFLDKVGSDKACLIMHTDVKDQHGQDLEAIIKELGLTNGEVLFSQQKVLPDQLAKMYNIADCTINISDAEGFGLATLESLSCGTPIIVNMTGGLQEQVTDGEEWFGIGLEPTSKAVIGSQTIPFIYEDRLSEEVVVDALLEMFNKTKEERKVLGEKGRHHVIKNYNFKDFCKKWDEVMTTIHEEEGSWETRRPMKQWTLEEIV